MLTSGPRILNGRYAIGGTARHGGMADVFAGTDTLSDFRKVAIKLFRKESIAGDLLAEAFRREVESLKELKHPSVVTMLESGVDDDTGRHFLVLEWFDLDLSEWLKTHIFEGWDSFYEEFGKPLLDALVFAHSREIIHRDIKPRNILVDNAGYPRLADFGIAKIKQWIEPGATLQDWVSRPYCPPEYDDGSFTYTRDVYAFAAIVLRCLTTVDILSYDSFPEALEEFDGPYEIQAILRRCLETDPKRRFENAIALCDAVTAVQVMRSREWLELTTYHLTLTRSGEDALKLALGDVSTSEVEAAVLEDLDEVSGFKLYASQENDQGKTKTDSNFRLFGAAFSYHVAIDRKEKYRLAVIKAWKTSQAQLEIYRQTAYTPTCRFTFGDAVNKFRASEDLQTLVFESQKSDVAKMEEDLVRRDQEMYYTWDRILNAKNQIEAEREAPLKYKGWAHEDNCIRFEMVVEPSLDLIDQPRRVVVENRTAVLGTVQSIDGRSLLLNVSQNYDDLIPFHGELLFDVAAAKTAIRRQHEALDAVRFFRSARPELRNLLARPDKACDPIPVTLGEMHQDLDTDKVNVVRLACGAPDFLLVEGPPGTGKTTFIVETILQYLDIHPSAKILLTSQTHVALDNALERIQALAPDLKVLRLASQTFDRVSPAVRHLLLSERMDQWKKEVLTRGEDFLERWVMNNNIPRQDFEVGRHLEEYLGAIKELQYLSQRREELSSELQGPKLGKTGLSRSVDAAASADSDADDLAELREDIAQLNAEIKGKNASRANIAKTLKVLEPGLDGILEGSENEIREWADLFMPKGIAIDMLRRLISVRAEWDARFGKSDDFYPALIADAKVIAGTCVGFAGVKGMAQSEFDLCIVDEASKASQTEVLVPLSRSKSWVLVGDRMQLPPFEEDLLEKSDILEKFDLRKEDVRETLFGRLEFGLPSSCKSGLYLQHRMVPAIGDLISNCFYDGSLKSVDQDRDAILAEIFGAPVIWFSTSGLQKRHETVNGFSFSNETEIRKIRDILERVNSRASAKGQRFSVAILSAYLAQTNALKHDLSLKAESWSSLDIECNTVDAFQGREADIAIYTLTRSNAKNTIGHMKDVRRLNVALSRGKKYLVIVGDHLFARTVTGSNPFRTVVDYIENHPKDCLIKELMQ